MVDEQETIAATPEAGSEAPTAPIATDTEEPRKLEDDLSGSEPEGEEVTEPTEVLEDDIEEFDWNGKKVKGPKGLKDGVLMHADYTRKTQEVAQTRKELDAEKQRIAEQAKSGEEELKLRASFIAKQEELEQYRKIDWDAWVHSDPVAAQQAFIRQQSLERSVADLSQQLQTRAQQRTAEAQQELAKRLAETAEYARKNIKGWTPDTDHQVLEFAKEQGVDLATLQSVMNPTVYRILHLARLGAHTLAKPAAPPQLKQPVAPLETVAAKASPPARKSLGEMNMEEYAAFRKKQIAASS